MTDITLLADSIKEGVRELAEENERLRKRVEAMEKVVEAAKVYYEAWPVLGCTEYSNLDAALRALEGEGR